MGFWTFRRSKKQLKKYKRSFYHQKNPYNVGLDSAILMNSEVWKASGHLGGFADLMVDCKECKSRFRADKLLEESGLNLNVDGLSSSAIDDLITTHLVKCPKCLKHNFNNARSFNLMFKTFIGTLEDAKSSVYLRPETAWLHF